MRLSSSLAVLIALVVVLLHQGFSPVAASVEATCKAAAAGSNLQVNYTFCLTSLQAVPGSSSADTRGLAVIATSLALANATSTKAKIEDLLKKPADPLTNNLLKDCLSFYSDTIPVLESSVDAIKSGNFKDAASKIDGVKNHPWDCEDEFFEGAKTSPVEKEDSDSAGLMAVAVAITSQLG